MRISVWNIRGMGMPGNSVLVKDRFLATNSNILGLVETKRESLKGTLLEKWLGSASSNMSWIEAPSKGKSGGLVLAWDNDYFSKTKSSIGKRWILVEGRLLKENNMDVSFLLVYAPNKAKERSSFYKELKELSISPSHPLMAFGDFNEIRKPEERKNNRVTVPTTGMKDFETWINDMQLLQIPLLLRKFSWYYLCPTKDIASYIDRVFVHEEWTKHFNAIKMWGLETSHSDHSYILIGCDSEDWVPENHDRFIDLEFKKSFMKKDKPLENLNVHINLKKIISYICAWNWFILDDIKTLIDEENFIDDFANLSIVDSDKLDTKCSNSTCIEVESVKHIEEILQELRIELGELDVQRESNLNVIKMVELGIKLEELVIELKKKHAQCEAKDCTLVLKHAERVIYYVDKLDIYGEDSDVTDTEVVQSINHKIGYMTRRIEYIDLRCENTAFTSKDQETRKGFKAKLVDWLTVKEMYWFEV